MGDLSAFQFDANQWNDEPAAFVQIPDGEYNCVVQSAEVEENAKGTLVTLVIQIIDSGEYINRTTKMWIYLAGHATAKYQERCSIQFAALCKAVGVFNPQDTTEIVAKPFLCDMKTKKTDDGSSFTEVRNFRRSTVKAETEQAPF